MKTNYLPALLLILWAGSSCRVLKEKQRQQEKNAHTQRLEWTADSRLDTRTDLRQASERQDTLWQQYRVVIYPLDSFRYDPHNGFSGKAARIELSGSSREHRIQRGSLLSHTQTTAHNQSTTRVKKETQNSNTFTNSSKKRRGYIPAILGILALLAAFFYLRKRLPKLFV